MYIGVRGCGTRECWRAGAKEIWSGAWGVASICMAKGWYAA